MKRIEKKPTNRVGLGLLLSVHWYAFCKAPKAYLTAVWWWLRRKRVRAHSQFASLLGRAPNAYRLWLKREEIAATHLREVSTHPQIIALIDASADVTHLEETLRSLSAEGVVGIVVGASEGLTFRDVARQIHWDERPWLMPLAAGDRLAPGTGAAYRAAITETNSATRIIYADDDLLDEKGREHVPHFKPDWNAELFCHFDYLSGAAVLHATREDIEACSTSPDWVRKLIERLKGAGTPLHLPRMLHHRRFRPHPKTPATPLIVDRELPPVTVIVPTRNRVDLVRTCIEGIAATDYPDIETIIVDNDSDDPETLAWLAGLDPMRYRVLRHAGVFNFSKINNRAAMEAQGRLLCLLNNDIEMIGPDWLRIMVIQAQRENVGAVGAQLLYPDGRIQHAGVVIGMGNAAGHAHRFLRPEEEGYFHRHSLPHFTMAVTAACLVVERERFLAVGGLDEENFAVAFNDVDLCLRLNQRGWQSFYEPRAKLIHHESVSRGFDRDPVGAARFAKELAALQKIWRTDEVTDPFHHPQLSRASEQFVVRL